MIYNKNIEYLSGDSNFDLSPELPFSKQSCDFLGDLSMIQEIHVNDNYFSNYKIYRGGLQ